MKKKKRGQGQEEQRKEKGESEKNGETKGEKTRKQRLKTVNPKYARACRKEKEEEEAKLSR